MKRKLLVSAIAAATLGLTGCVEVEDNDLTKAIKAQNELLAGQNDILSSEAAKTESVTLTGKVVHVETGLPVVAGTAKYRLGSMWSDPVDLVDGKYEFTGLAGNSDIEIMVEPAAPAEGEAAEFMAYTIAGMTRYTDDNQAVTYQSADDIYVSQGKEYAFAVNNYLTGEPVSTLTLTSGNGLNHYVSTFDSESGMYKITLPMYMLGSVYADLDLDHDGDNDYVVVDAYDFGEGDVGLSTTPYFMIPSWEVRDEKSYSLLAPEAPAEEQALTINVSLVNDSTGKAVTDAVATLVDADNGVSGVHYNAETGFYTFSNDFGDSESVTIFFANDNLEDEIRTNSSYIRVTRNDSGDFYTVSDYKGFGYDEYDYKIDENGEIFVVSKVLTADNTPTTDSGDFAPAKVIEKGVTEETYEAKVYLSGPVALLEDNDGDDDYSNDMYFLESTKRVITPGKDADGAAAPGTTFIGDVKASIPMTMAFSANNTILTATPSEALEPGVQYGYKIGYLQDAIFDDKDNNQDVFVTGNSRLTFTTEQEETATDAFSMEDIVIDNFNYYANGALVVAKNTADTAVTVAAAGADPVIVLPASVDQLKTLSMRLVSTTVGTTDTTHNVRMEFISNGRVNFSSPRGCGSPTGHCVSQQFVSSMAENETLATGSAVSFTGSLFNPIPSAVRGGSIIDDQKHYTFNGLEGIAAELADIADHTDAAPATVTFEYNYITNDNVPVTGVITYQVK